MKVLKFYIFIEKTFKFLFLDTQEVVQVIAVLDGNDGNSAVILAKTMLPAFIYSALIQLSPEQRNDEEVVRTAIVQSFLE